MAEFILEMKDITKTFPGVVALDRVNLSVRKGDVHALVGENGAGKSTLMKILNGVYPVDSGDIYLSGEKIFIKDTTTARKFGIGLIFQECNLVNALSAAENIYLNRQKRKGIRIDWKSVNQDAQKLIDNLGFSFDVTQKVENLSAAERQLVEIAKVLSYETKIIVMDEPTSSLTMNETKKLFEIIENLKSKGITVIYISHKLDEIFRICNRVTVLRDGKTIETRNVKDFTRKEIIECMVGRSMDMEFPERDTNIGEVILKVSNLSRTGAIRNITFELHRGEILGIAGLVGSGRTELAETLFGAEKPTEGKIELFGKKIRMGSTYYGKKSGIGLLTEDRKETGLVLSYNIIQNISVTKLDKFQKGLFLSAKKEKELASKYAVDLGVKTPSMKQVVINLSGGNQQKVVFAKWLFSDADILILDEPTRGVDVGAKYDIYLLMNELARQGKSLIMISSELPEVLGMSDRILIMNAGEVKGELKKADATPEQVMNIALS